MNSHGLEGINIRPTEVCNTSKIELSDRLKNIVNDLGVIENILNDVLYRTSLVKHMREEELPPIECHTHAIDLIENRAYWLRMIAEKLEQELR